MQKIILGFGIVALFSVVFMLLGIFIDIQIILKYDYTPISFTFIFLLIGSIIGLLVTLKKLNISKNKYSKN